MFTKEELDLLRKILKSRIKEVDNRINNKKMRGFSAEGTETLKIKFENILSKIERYESEMD